jgi:hypothetical protein
MFKQVSPKTNSNDLTTYPIIGFALLAALAVPAFPLSAQTPSYASLPGHVVSALANATRLPHTRAMDEEPIKVTVVFNLSDPQGAKALEEEYSTPTSLNYHRTITASEFTSRFGPSQEAWNTVLVYLEQNGLTLSHGTIDQRMMSVTGTRAQVQKAFHVLVDNYQLGDRAFHAVASDPIVPAAIAPLIATVAGLSNLARPLPFSNLSPAWPASIATAYNGTLTPASATNTGGLPPGLDGANVTIGLLEEDGFDPKDVSTWLSLVGLPADLIHHIVLYGTVSPSGCTPSTPKCGTTEVLLDIAAALGIAPGATIEIFENEPDANFAVEILDALYQLSLASPAVLSISGGVCEFRLSPSDAAAIDSYASSYMLSGISVFAGTGDTGASCINGPDGEPANSISVPADSPHVVAVGGTTLNVDSNNSYDSESWWKSGGFGTSVPSTPEQPLYFAEPGYQSKWYPGATGRSVPDVSMYAAPGVTICQPDCTYTIRGTSLATPLWAATWALLQQASSDAGMGIPNAGFGGIYALHEGLHAASTMTGTGNDFQHVGLGSPDITKLIAIAVPPKIIGFYPSSGSSEGGTKVTIYGQGGFIGVKKVTFGGHAGTNLKIESDTLLTVETPSAHHNAAAEINVVTPGGTATGPLPCDYDPVIDNVAPAVGITAGGTTVTVSGVALSDDLTFEFIAEGEADHKATKVSCDTTHRSCTMLSPAHVAGTVNVVAVAPWGYTSPISSANQFTYCEECLAIPRLAH